MNSTPHGPSRRTLVKGAAWSVPVVAVAGAAPAHAASPEPVVPPTFLPGSACKFPGGSCKGWNHAYRATFCMTNNTDEPITVQIVGIRVNGKTHRGQPSQVVVPATGEPFCFYTIANATGSSANGTLSMDYTYTYIDENGQTVVERGTASTGGQNNLPPCDDCASEYGQAGAAMTPDEAALSDDTLVTDDAADAGNTEPVENPAPIESEVPLPVPPPSDDASTTSSP